MLKVKADTIEQYHILQFLLKIVPGKQLISHTTRKRGR